MTSDLLTVVELSLSNTTKSLRRCARWLFTRTRLHILFLVTNILVFALVQIEVPDPYLDEIFHIPQTQRYCEEDFDSWDPAITTPPGLYLLTAIPLATVHIPCRPSILRSANLLFSTFIIPFLVSLIIAPPTSSVTSRTPSPRRSRWPAHLFRPSTTALVISSFPLIHFFGNLYYTDVASLAGVLGCWALASRSRHWFAAIVGAWSITVRQTNVIWVAFILGVSLLNVVAAEEAKLLGEKQQRGMTSLLISDVASPFDIISSTLSTIQIATRIPGKIVRTCLPYTPVFLGFGAFVILNGGIVLGHKENHQPVLHLPQVMYWIAFSSMSLAPALLAGGPLRLVKGSFTIGFGSPIRIFLSSLLFICMLGSVHFFTLIHPFLLADNRHYAFYLFRWLIRPYPAARYLLCLPYLVCTWAWAWRLRHSVTVLWLAGFLACTAVTVVPTPLIEPRYFLIPTIILRIQLAIASSAPPPPPSVASSPSRTVRVPEGSTADARSSATRETDTSGLRARSMGSRFTPPEPQRPESTPAPESTGRLGSESELSLLLEYGWYALINTATVGLFLMKRFRWEGWEGWMRFMW